MELIPVISLFRFLISIHSITNFSKMHSITRQTHFINRQDKPTRMCGQDLKLQLSGWMGQQKEDLHSAILLKKPVTTDVVLPSVSTPYLIQVKNNFLTNQNHLVLTIKKLK